MTKEKELEIIKKEVTQGIELFEKRDTLNTQLIDELDKQLTSAKYGSVGHVTKITRLSSLRNYRMRLQEVVDALKQITDLKSVETIEGYIIKVVEDAKTNLNASSNALDTVEVFSNDYIKHEILVKTYKDLLDLYNETLEFLKKVKETVKPAEQHHTPELTPTQEQPAEVRTEVEKKQVKKETA